VAGGAQVGPEIWMNLVLNTGSSSWIFTATSGSSSVQLQLGQGTANFRKEGSTITIVEV
jgi:hypothetical protein